MPDMCAERVNQSVNYCFMTKNEKKKERKTSACRFNLIFHVSTNNLYMHYACEPATNQYINNHLFINVHEIFYINIKFSMLKGLTEKLMIHNLL